MIFEISLTILILVLGLQIIRHFGGLFGYRSIFVKSIFISSVVLVFLLLFYTTWQQFEVWSQNEFSKFLLPPYQALDYFIFYSFFKFFAPYLISLFVALVFLFTAKFLNKKYQERFFYSEELYFGALAIFLVGHPGWLFYIVFLIVIYLLIHLYSLFIIYDLSRRISLYYWWMPVGIFVILISNYWLSSLPLWQLLKV
ncbi:MAG: hypothetical protein V3T98_02475 [Candidatus Paceibacterota bacterium]